MPVLRSARALVEAPITTVKKNPIDAKVKSLQDQLAAAHAQNERMAETMKEKDAEHARVTEVKDAKIESLEAEVARLTAERAAALVANAQPAARPNALVPVAQGGWVTPLEHFLNICKYDIHDNAPMFPNEPPVPCTKRSHMTSRTNAVSSNARGSSVGPPESRNERRCDTSARRRRRCSSRYHIGSSPPGASGVTPASGTARTASL